MLSKIECFKIKIIHFTPDFSHYSVDFPLCFAQILLAMQSITSHMQHHLGAQISFANNFHH